MYERLENLCEKNGISITKLCVEITGSKGNLSTWKKGNINSESLRKIADYFDVSADYLLGRTDSPSVTGGTYIKNNNNNVNQAINGDVNISAGVSEKDDKQLFDMIKGLNLVQRSETIVYINNLKKKEGE